MTKTGLLIRSLSNEMEFSLVFLLFTRFHNLVPQNLHLSDTIERTFHQAIRQSWVTTHLAPAIEGQKAGRTSLHRFRLNFVFYPISLCVHNRKLVRIWLSTFDNWIQQFNGNNLLFWLVQWCQRWERLRSKRGWSYESGPFGRPGSWSSLRFRQRRRGSPAVCSNRHIESNSHTKRTDWRMRS